MRKEISFENIPPNKLDHTDFEGIQNGRKIGFLAHLYMISYYQANHEILKRMV